jgi:lambda repressor-like predicted transcriptional regulator
VKLSQIINEAIIKRLQAQLAKKAKLLNIEPTVLEASIEAITDNPSFQAWVLKSIANIDQIASLKELLERFSQKKTRLPSQNIYDYSIESLQTELDKDLKLTQSELRKAQHGGLVLPPGAKIIAEEDNYQIVEVTSVEALTQLSSRTEWCTANKPQAKEYLESGPLFLVYKSGERHSLLSPYREKPEYKNVANKTINEKSKSILLSILKPYLMEKVEAGDVKTALFCARLYGTGLNNRVIKSISRNAKYSYEYAEYVLEGPFPAGEEAISMSAKYSFSYAYYLEGPFPAGEEAISKNAEYSYKYARYVLKGPFPAGEEAISENATYSYFYAEEVLEGPFPAGEEAISKDAVYSYKYAKVVLEGPFPAGEEAISNDAEYSYYYAKDVLKGPFPAVRKL